MKINRRGFMKVLLGCSAAAALPVVGKAVSNKPVTVIKKAHNVGITGVDLGKPCDEESFVVHNVPVSREKIRENMFGRYESARFVKTEAYGVPRRKGLDYPQANKDTVFIESTPSGESSWYDTLEGYERVDGGDHLQESMRKAMAEHNEKNDAEIYGQGGYMIPERMAEQIIENSGLGDQYIVAGRKLGQARSVAAHIQLMAEKASALKV